MVSNEVNTVVLSKSSYDNMRGTNDRASMLLREIPALPWMSCLN